MRIEFTQFWKYRKRWHTSELEYLLWNFTELWIQDMLQFTNLLLFKYDLLCTVFTICVRKFTPFLLPKNCGNVKQTAFHLLSETLNENKILGTKSRVDLNWEIKENNEQSVQIFRVQNIEVSFYLRTFNWLLSNF